MRLRIGELARQVGLSVRTLHHYDAIGLLRPSGRSAKGYRLYGRDEVVRLHAILALKAFGCSLVEVREALAQGEAVLPELLARQIDILAAKERQARELGDRLRRLRERVVRNETTTMDDWLVILGKMQMFGQYFSTDELAVLRAGSGAAGEAGPVREAWRELANGVALAMDRGVWPESDEAAGLVRPVIALARKLTGGDPALGARLREMLFREERARQAAGLTAEGLAWIDAAVAALREKDAAVAALREKDVAGAALREKDAAGAALREQDAAVAAQGEKDAAGAALQGKDAAGAPQPTATAAPWGTALAVATLRAAHQLLDDPPVFVDPLALRLVGPGREAAIRRDPARFDAGGLRGLRVSVAVRSRLAEDAWAAARDRGIGQYVILGAGFDTFAYRTPDRKSRIFEVDHPGTLAEKRRRLAEAGVAVPDNLTFAPLDFERQALGTALGAAGFDPGRPAFFSWLGVAMYLTEQVVWSVLAEIAGLAAGSRVVFDYPVLPALLTPAERQAREAILARCAARGEPWRSAFAPAAVGEGLAALGFGPIEDLGGPELTARYLAGRPDGLVKNGLTRVVLGTLGP
uniref:Methyltransferase, putative, TIGR00027 family n=1 Tax=Desulfovibrio sp. U5L TaxID=596152 RepID=I2Q3Q8_9BACT